MGRYDTRRVQKLSENKLKKVLDTPERRAQEAEFSAAHAEDSDKTLLSYVAELQQRTGGKLKAADVIGYRYLTERLGPWPGIMTRVNELFRAETKNKEN